jgi:hypothetical protein
MAHVLGFIGAHEVLALIGGLVIAIALNVVLRHAFHRHRGYEHLRH